MTFNMTFFQRFRGESGIDIDLRRVDINQCKGRGGTGTLNIFGGTDKCKTETTLVRPSLKAGPSRFVSEKKITYEFVETLIFRFPF